jgi:type III pantothenate kinase
MSRVANFPLIAVDVGNSRIKFGRFDSVDPSPKSAAQLPAPGDTLDLGPEAEQLDQLDRWLGADRLRNFSWWIGSVQRTVASQLVDWLRRRGVEHITLLAAVDLPIQADVPRPDMVGIDRLLGAVAANRLRAENRPAVVVDLGTAITVDLVSPAGAFLGGAILPGIGLSARALHDFTDLLPRFDMQSLAEPPTALGTNTIEAMRAGIYWGAVGGVRQLIDLLTTSVGSAPQIYLTGGAAPTVARLLAHDAIYVPHLVLAGIVLAAME